MKLLAISVILALQLAGCVVSAHVTDAPPLPTCLNAQGDKLCLGPSQAHAIYGAQSLLRHGTTGKGRTIAIIDSFGSPTIRRDLHQFDLAFHLPDPKLEIYAPLGTLHPPHTGWEGETTLDVEWAHAMAPGARIMLLTSPVDETEGVQGFPQFLTLERYAVSHGADVVSQSWAATEDTLLTPKGRAIVSRFHNFYKEASGKGVTFVGASGDGGAAGETVSMDSLYPYRVVQWPSSDPYVLAIGGTRLEQQGKGWNEVAWPLSGGGFSKIYGEPAFQRALPAATQRAMQGHRALPDVALDASGKSPLVIYDNGRWDSAAGTSASTPAWAGLMALVDAAAKRRVGSIHATLYRLAHSGRYHSDFRDITVGSIEDPSEIRGTVPPLHAGPGWDPATGLGTPHMAALVRDLISSRGR